MLTQAEIASYRENGFVTPNYRLAANQLDLLRELAEDLIERNTHLGDAPLASPHVPGSGTQNLRSDPRWMNFPTDPDILDMVEQLIGPDIVWWGTTLFHKAAGTGRAVPWHRDGRYWPLEPLATPSVWIAIDDSTVGNGCLRCLAGSHRDRELGAHYRSEDPRYQIPETLHVDQYDESTARDVELEAGQMVVFDVYTAHGSNANTSDARRIGYAMRFIPSTSHFNHHTVPVPDSPGAGHHTRPLLLVRGEDRCGKNDFELGHPSAADSRDRWDVNL